MLNNYQEALTNYINIKCCVPECNSNSIKDPTKIFVKLPKSIDLQEKWAKAVGRTDSNSVFGGSSELFCCEEHLNLPKDIVNWNDVQNKSSQKKLKDNVLRCKRKLSSESSAPLKKKYIDILNCNTTSQKDFSKGQACDNDKIQTMKNIKHCFVPNCKSQKMLIRLPNDVEINEKFPQANCRKDKSTIFHKSSAVFCCTDHLEHSKDMHIKQQEPPNIILSKSQESETANYSTSDKLLISIKSESEDSILPDLLMCNGNPNKELIKMEVPVTIEVESEDKKSNTIENIEEILIKTEPYLQEEIELVSEQSSSSNFKPKLKDDVNNHSLGPIQIIEERGFEFSPDEIEISSEEESKIHNGELVILRDDIPGHQKLRSFLLSKVNKIHSPLIGEDMRCAVKQNERNKCTAVDIKYLPKNINISLNEERSSQFFKLLHTMKDTSIKTKSNEEHNLMNSSNNLEFTKTLVNLYPTRYTGLPSNVFKGFIRNLQRGTKVPYNNILLVLLKIRENQSFEILSDSFLMSQEEALKIFIKSVPIIANYLQREGYWPEMNTMSQIPLPFKRVFNNVKLIMDCLEIEVNKPKVPQTADILKSLKRNCYTVRYLISYTPIGLINCMSQGFGGSREDDFLIQSSGFLPRLNFPVNVEVLTYKNYHQCEKLFNQKNCNLLRLEEEEEIQSLEEFALKKRLREYVGNVMKRLREFKYISSHACLDHELSSVLDFVVIIASAIVNTQGSVPIEKEKSIII